MKDKINTLIEKRNIKRIVYVDNEFEIDVYKSNIKLFLRKNISDTNIKWPFPIDAGIDYALQECEKWLSNDQEKDNILKFIKEQSITRETNRIEKGLEDILPPNMLHCVTSDEFKNQYVDNPIFIPTETEQLVILMDMYIEGENANSGMRLLTTYKDKEYVACGLFSDRFNINDEIKNWKYCDNAKNIYPLSKSRVTESENAFLLGLRNVVWLRQISDIKSQILNLYTQAFNKTSKDIESLDPASFDSAIIKSSEQEGCWEFDIMKRIILLLLNKHVERVMIDGNEFSKLQNLTKILKQISDSPQCENIPNSTLLNEYYKSEVYADISYVNSTYSQIANGDIFEIEGKNNKKSKYMLVCQPCNLELRSDTSRKSSDFVYLLPIEQLSKLAEKRKSHISVLQQLSNEESLCVNMAANVRINPKILDLVCYNKNGAAILDINKDNKNLDDSHVMQTNMLKHYQKIYNKICNTVDLCRKIDSVPKDILDNNARLSILKMLKKPFELASENLVSADCNLDTGIINFNIKRVDRYKEPFSQIVLHDFMNYLSRQALPNDFSKIAQ